MLSNFLFEQCQLLSIRDDNWNFKQCCPDLHVNGVFAVPTKVLILRFRFSALKKQLDLPAIFVDRSNGACREMKNVGEKHQLTLVLGIPHSHLAQ